MCQLYKPHHAVGERLIVACQTNYENMDVWDNINNLVECWLTTPTNRISVLTASLHPVDYATGRPAFGLQEHDIFTGFYKVSTYMYVFTR